MPTPEVDGKQQEILLRFPEDTWTLQERIRVSQTLCPACPLSPYTIFQCPVGYKTLVCETLPPPWTETAIFRVILLPNEQLGNLNLLPDDEETVRRLAECLK